MVAVVVAVVVAVAAVVEVSIMLFLRCAGRYAASTRRHGAP